MPQDPKKDRFAKHWPTLWEFLCLELWPDDGSPRVPGSLMLFLQDGLIKARLRDAEAGEVIFLAAQTVEGALDAAERVLANGEGDWRKDKWEGKPAGRRR